MQYTLSHLHVLHSVAPSCFSSLISWHLFFKVTPTLAKPLFPEPASVSEAQALTHTETFPLVYQQLTYSSGPISSGAPKKLQLLSMILLPPPSVHST